MIPTRSSFLLQSLPSALLISLFNSPKERDSLALNLQRSHLAKSASFVTALLLSSRFPPQRRSPSILRSSILKTLRISKYYILQRDRLREAISNDCLGPSVLDDALINQGFSEAVTKTLCRSFIKPIQQHRTSVPRPTIN